MSDMSTLYFEKISRFDRPAEPVTVSIPFAPGALGDPACLVIFDRRRPLAAQRRVLARWPDGSVKWLLVHCQPDLPGNRGHELGFAVVPAPPAVDIARPVTVTAAPEALLVDTGALSFRLPRHGFLPLAGAVTAAGRAWPEDAFDGFRIRCSGADAGTAGAAVTLEIEEAGPLRAVILLHGRHRRADGEPGLAFRGRVTAFAGKPWVECEYQFVHDRPEEELALEEIRLAFRPGPSAEPTVALGEGHYRTVVSAGRGPLAQLLDAQTILSQAYEHAPECFYGDFWAAWRDAAGGLVLTVHQAHQHFPKKLAADPAGLTCHLYPPEAPPARLLRGMARTQRLFLHFHGPEATGEELAARSLQFQLPDRPALDPAWVRRNNPWGEEGLFPEKIPARLYTYFNRLFDRRPGGLGLFHFGDAPDAVYTAQGRGGGAQVWVNNEYDHPHAATLYYFLTGQRRVLESALASARHWLDVDLCHFSPDPLAHGGLRTHARHHAGGVDPSHQWTEGLLDYYFLTGRAEALAAARGVGENILGHLRRPEFGRPGQLSTRVGGWALRALAALARDTGEPRWREAAGEIVDLFAAWQREQGGLLAPYTSHSMPRVPFMIALTANSLARAGAAAGRPDVGELVLAVARDLEENCLGPDGIFIYKELPSLRRSAPTPHVLETLTHAWRFSGEERFLRLAVRQFAAMIGEPASAAARSGKRAVEENAVVFAEGRACLFAQNYVPVLLFAAAAAAAGRLDWYDYPC